MFSTRVLSRRFLPLLPLALVPSLLGQGVFLNGSGIYTQNFNTLPTAGGTNWVNDSTLPGWLAFTDATPNPLPIGIYNGGTAAVSGLLSMGLTGDADRALGFRPTTTNYGMTMLGFVMRNVTAMPMTIGRVEFTGELWHTQQTANNVDGYQVFYQVGTSMPASLGPFTVNNGATYAANAAVEDANWTRLPELEYSEANAAANVPLTPHLSRVVSLNFMGLTLQPGQFLTFRWRNPNDTSGDAVMGIDNFAVSHSLPGASLVYNPAHGLGGEPNGVLAPSAAQYWTNGAAGAGFAHGDRVTFSADATATIDVPASALVTSMTVSAQAGTYTIGGAGRVEGALVKSGSGGLVLTGSNSFSSVTLQDGGTIVAQGAGSLNANTLAMTAGGTLAIGGDSTIFQAVTGTGPLNKTGAGLLRLGGGATANTYTGLTTVSAGTLEAAKNAGTLAIPGSLVIEAGAAFRYGGDNRGNQIGDGATVTINGGSFGDPNTVTPVNPGASETVLNLVMNGGDFHTGRATFVANNEITLNAGTARVSRGGTLIAGSRLTVGGTMNLDGGSTTAGQESRLIVGGGGLVLNGGTINLNTGPSALTATSAGSIITLGGNIVSTGDSTIARFNAATVVLRADMDFQGFNRTVNVTGSLAIGSAQAPVVITNGGITKTGPGVLSLGGAQTFLQATTVNEGKFLIDGSLASSVVSVGAAGTFGGNGTASGAVQVSSGGAIEAGLGNSGALALASLRLGTAAGDTATMTIPLQAPAALSVTNADGLVANSGAASVTVQVKGAVPSIGQHALIDYEGAIGGAGFGAFVLGGLPNRVAAQLINDAGATAILLDVTAVDQPVWTGAVSSEWSTATLGNPKNWVLKSDSVTGTDFLANDYVVFADALNPIVEIDVEDVTPAQTRFTNANTPYAITGSKAIAGSGEVLIEGAAGVSFENVNTFTGPVIITAGILTVPSLTDAGVAGPLGAGNRIVLNGGALEITGPTASTDRAIDAAVGGLLNFSGQVTLAGSLSGAGTVTKSGAGQLVLTGSNDGFNGRLAITQGSVRSTGGSIGGASVTVALEGGELEHVDAIETIFNDAGAILRALELGFGGGTLKVANAAGAMTFQRQGGASGFGTLVKTGPGIVRMQASNPALAAAWVLEEGVIEAGAADALGTGSVTVNGGLLAARNSFVSTAVTMNGGALGTRTGDLGDFAGAVTINAPSSVLLRSYSTPTDARSLTISGMLSGAADLRVEGNLPGTGAALIVTNPNNTYSGTFRVAPGQTLTSRPITFGNPLGSATVELTAGRLNLLDDGFGDNGVILYSNPVTIAGAGSSQIDVNRAGGISVGNTVEIGSLSIGAQKLIVTGANQYRLGVTGTTTLTAAATFEPQTADLVLHGDVTGAFGFTKTGAGRLIIDGFASFNGAAEVQAGMLVFNGVSSDTVDVLVSGGTFAGAGVLAGNATFAGASVFAPGDAMRGFLQIDQALSLHGATTVQFNLAHGGAAAPVAGDDYAQVQVGYGNSGTVSLNGAVLSLTIGAGIQENDLFFLILNDDVDPISGQFAGLGQGGTFLAGGQLFQISYSADGAAQTMSGGNDIALQAIPEPGSVLLVAGGFLLCAASRRRGLARD